MKFEWKESKVNRFCMLCLKFLELLEFWQGFKAFLSQIFDLFSVAKGVLFIGKGFIVWRGQVAPTSYARG